MPLKIIILNIKFTYTKHLLLKGVYDVTESV